MNSTLHHKIPAVAVIVLIMVFGAGCRRPEPTVPITAVQNIPWEKNLLLERDIELTASSHNLDSEKVGNLLDNACKWANRKVEVHCSLDHDRMTVSVEDDGPGIPEEYMERALKRGRKLDESAPGYGQGLSIVNEIATLYGGRLKLGRSELGGLSAELELPAVA